MKQKKISLTIGIPMYNHEKTIITTLDSILCQLDEIKNLCELEVLICDNCSTDESPRIVKEYQKKYPKIIKYHKNKTNIGGLQNLKKVYELASKDYIWVLGDDIMVKGAIKSFYGIFQFCLQQKNKQPSIILTNFLHENDAEEVVTKKDVIKENLPVSANYTIYDNLEDMHKNNKIRVLHATMLGVLIIKKDKLLEILHGINFDDPHPQFIAYLKITKSQTVAFLDEVLIFVKQGAWMSKEKAEFCILVTLTYHSMIKDIYGDYLLGKEETQNQKISTFYFIKNYYKDVKNPKLIVDEFLKITFFNKRLLSVIKFLSRLKMDSLAFKILVIYAKNYGNKKLKKRLLAIILITILIYLIFKL